MDTELMDSEVEAMPQVDIQIDVKIPEFDENKRGAATAKRKLDRMEKLKRDLAAAALAAADAADAVENPRPRQPRSAMNDPIKALRQLERTLDMFDWDRLMNILIDGDFVKLDVLIQLLMDEFRDGFGKPVSERMKGRKPAVATATANGKADDDEDEDEDNEDEND